MAVNNSNNDMTLVIGADVDSSFNQIKQDILAIAKKFDENPINLKIRLDKTSEADVKGQLSSLTKQIESGTYKLHIDVDDSGVKEATEAVKTLKKEQQKKVVVGQTDTSAIDAQIDKNKKLISTEKELAKAKANANSDISSATNANNVAIQKEIELQTKLAEASERASKAKKEYVSSIESKAGGELYTMADDKYRQLITSGLSNKYYKNIANEIKARITDAYKQARAEGESELFSNALNGSAYLTYKNGSSAYIDDEGILTQIDELGNVTRKYLSEMLSGEFKKVLTNLKYAMIKDDTEAMDTAIGDYSELLTKSESFRGANLKYLEMCRSLTQKELGDKQEIARIDAMTAEDNKDWSNFVKQYNTFSKDPSSYNDYINKVMSAYDDVRKKFYESSDVTDNLGKQDGSERYYNAQIDYYERKRAAIEALNEAIKQYKSTNPEFAELNGYGMAGRYWDSNNTILDDESDLIRMIKDEAGSLDEVQSKLLEAKTNLASVSAQTSGNDQIIDSETESIERQKQALEELNNEKLVSIEQQNVNRSDTTDEINAEKAALESLDEDIKQVVADKRELFNSSTKSEDIQLFKDDTFKQMIAAQNNFSLLHDKFSTSTFMDLQSEIADANKLLDSYNPLSSTDEEINSIASGLDAVKERFAQTKSEMASMAESAGVELKDVSYYFKDLRDTESLASATNEINSETTAVKQLDEAIKQTAEDKKELSAQSDTSIKDTFSGQAAEVTKTDEAVKELKKDVQEVGAVDANLPGEVFKKTRQEAEASGQVIRETAEAIDELNNVKTKRTITYGEDEFGDKTATSIKETTQEIKTEKQALEELAQAENKVAGFKRQISSMGSTLSNIGGSEDLTNQARTLSDRLLDLQGKISAFEAEANSPDGVNNYKLSITELDTEVKNLQTDVEGLSNAMKNQKAIEKAGTTTNTMLKQMSQYNAKLSSYENGKLTGDKTSEYAEINALQARLSSAFSELSKTGNISAFNSELEKIRSAYTNATASADNFIRASKETTRSFNAGRGALGAYNSGISNSSKVLTSWTAALKSSDKEVQASVQSIKEQRANLESLYDAYNKGQISGQQFSNGVRASNQIIKQNMQSLKDAGVATQTWGDKVGGLAQKFSMWLGTSQIIMRVVRSMREMVQTAIEVDDAMTQLKIVTRDTDETYEQFSETIAKSAQELGVSITDLIDATTTYARLGYTLDESTTLSKFTTMLQQVGDIDASDAQDAMTTVIKAFNIGTDEVEASMDKLVAVGKKKCPSMW